MKEETIARVRERMDGILAPYRSYNNLLVRFFRKALKSFKKAQTSLAVLSLFSLDKRYVYKLWRKNHS